MNASTSPPRPATSARLIDAQAITQRHDACLLAPQWPAPTTLPGPADLGHWIDENHRCNALLWAQEDLARRTMAPDAEIVANKRAIDRLNQQRNDAVERLDEWLVRALGWVAASAISGAPSQVMPPTGARLHSESMGSIVDRLSILSLKIRAVHGLMRRADAMDAGRDMHAAKWQALQAQRTDLANCLDALWSDAVEGRAYFKIYRPFKLYNDPATNPALLAERARRPGLAP